MHIYIMPISGGRFPNQLAEVNVIGKAGIKPDVVMACSGGNICAYTSMFSSWCVDYKRDMVLQNLYSMVNIVPWTSSMFNFVPDFLMLFNKGSVFKKIGDKTSFCRCFTSKTIKNTEIWTNVYNRLHDKIECFCNLSKSECHIQPIDLDTSTVLPPVYLDGNLDKIYDVSAATASIPGIFPQVWVNDQPCSDGGVACASPLTFLGPAIQEIMKTQNVHFVYFNPRPLFIGNVYEGDTLMSNVNMMIHHMNRFGIATEEALIRSMMAHYGELNFKYVEKGSHEEIVQWHENKKYYRHSMLEISPKTLHQLNIFNIDRTEISEMMDEVSENYALRLWWVENEPSQD